MATFKLILAFVCSAWHTFVVMTLWNWYVVAVFGVRPINFVLALGLSTFMGLFTLPIVIYLMNTEPPADKNKSIANSIARQFASMAGYAVALLIGWVGHFWL